MILLSFPCKDSTNRKVASSSFDGSDYGAEASPLAERLTTSARNSSQEYYYFTSSPQSVAEGTAASALLKDAMIWHRLRGLGSRCSMGEMVSV